MDQWVQTKSKTHRQDKQEMNMVSFWQKQSFTFWEENALEVRGQKVCNVADGVMI